MVQHSCVAATGVLLLVGLKILQIFSYTSTDFEVHRNWMAVTHNLPLSSWYFDDTSEWTLDYPPFFAYFEWILAQFASFAGFEKILALQKEPMMDQQVLIYQRLTVIASDLIYIAIVAIFAYRSSAFLRLPHKIQKISRLSAFLLLVWNSGLIIVDNIHFQYNSLLTSLVIASLLLVEENSFLMGGLVFAVLVNFKHIYAYYAPAYVFYYIRHYFGGMDLLTSSGKTLREGFVLALTLVIPFIFSLGPFFYHGGTAALAQIVQRLFPVGRGLTHAYWAPNYWALYNFVDLMLYRGLSLFGYRQFVAPTYSSGLVQVHSHSVLPTITPLISLMCILLLLTPLVTLMLQKTKNNFTVYLFLSAFAFYFVGYHVHEKALLLLTIPLLIESIWNPRFIPVTLLFTTVSSFALFPLLFTPFEIIIKYSVALTYILLLRQLYRSAFNVSLGFCFPLLSSILISGLVLCEVYSTFIHKLIFGSNFEFLPLMIISVYGSVCITTCYFWILKSIFEDDLLLSYKKNYCLIREELIKSEVYAVQSIESIEEVKVIAGVDISTSKTNPTFAVVALSIFEYPSLKHLDTFEDTTLIVEPYITDFLAIREAEPIANVVNRILELCPEYRPDVLICDGNGRFHSRGCGVACHIGALTGIPTIGVAKNLNLSLLKTVGANEDVLKRVDQLIEQVEREKSNGFSPFDAISPIVMNIVRVGGSKNPVFVSAGYGISLEHATTIVLRSSKSRICEPVRCADLSSREAVRKLFDD